MDLISRQDAIDALGERPIAWMQGEYETGLQNQYDSDVEALQNVLPAQQWIPCSERLPEIDVFVLVTLQHFNGEIDVVIAKVVKGFLPNELAWESDDGEWTWGIKQGIAWMPLPTPYHEERKKKNDD